MTFILILHILGTSFRIMSHIFRTTLMIMPVHKRELLIQLVICGARDCLKRLKYSYSISARYPANTSAALWWLRYPGCSREPTLSDVVFGSCR